MTGPGRAGDVQVTPFDLDTGVALFDLSVELVREGRRDPLRVRLQQRPL